MANNWFPHDSSARNDQRILMLRLKFGWHGYGLYWSILESMYEASDAKLDANALPALCLGFSIEEKELQEIVDYCVEIGLFQSEDGFLFSTRLVEQKKYHHERSEAARKSAEARWGKPKNANAERPQCEGNAQHNQPTDINNQQLVVDKRLESWLKQKKKGKGYVHWLLKTYGEAVGEAWEKVLGGHSVESPSDFAEFCGIIKKRNEE